LGDAIEHSARLNPGRAPLICGESSLSYSELDRSGGRKEAVMRKRWRRALVAVLSAGLLTCSSALAQQQKAQPPKSARLYVLDCGTLDIPDVSPYRFKKEDGIAQNVGTLLPGDTPQRNFDVGHRPGSRW
jgi:hypothetical protein